MKKFLLSLLGLLLIASLSYFCFLQKGDKLKHNILSKVDSTLISNDMDWAKAQLVGEGLKSTDIVQLTGDAPSDELRSKAQSLVSNIDGVGGVINNLQIQQAQAEEQEHVSDEEQAAKKANETQALLEKSQEEKSLQDHDKKSETKAKNQTLANGNYQLYMVKNAKGKVYMRGYVPNEEEHKALLQKAQKLFGEENIDDKIEIAKDAPKDWNYISQFGLEKLSEVDFGDMNITNNSYLFKAHLSSNEKKLEFLDGIKKVMADPNNHYGRYRGDYIVTAPVVKVASKEKIAKKEPIKKIDNKSAENKALKQKDSSKHMISCQELLDQNIASRKINFDNDSYRLNYHSYNILDDIVNALHSCDLNDKVLEIGGYTDSIGSANYNIRLSKKRAESIKNYLVKQGIDASKLITVGYGESFPIATNRTKEGRALNRRIEFKIKGVK